MPETREKPFVNFNINFGSFGKAEREQGVARKIISWLAAAVFTGVFGFLGWLLVTELGDSKPFLVWSLIIGFGIFAAAALWAASATAGEFRAIRDTPTTRIADAKPGYAEFVGRCGSLEENMLHAPLTGLPCCWYYYRISERKHVWSSTKGADRYIYEKLEEGCSGTLLLLDDGTGKCIVDPSGSTITPAGINGWHESKLLDAGAAPAGAPFIQPAPLSSSNTAEKYFYEEGRFAPGDPLYIIGRFSEGTAKRIEEGLRRKTGSLLGQWKKDPVNMLAQFDRDRNGELDLKEYNAAHMAARRQVIETERPETPITPFLITGPGDSAHPFIISGTSEFEVLTDVRTWRNAFYGCTLVFGSVSAWLLLLTVFL